LFNLSVPNSNQLTILSIRVYSSKYFE